MISKLVKLVNDKVVKSSDHKIIIIGFTNIQTSGNLTNLEIR